MRNYSTEVKSSVIFNFVNCNDEYYSRPDLHQVLHCLFLQFEESDMKASMYSTEVRTILNKDADLSDQGTLFSVFSKCLSGSELDALLGCLSAFRRFALMLDNYFDESNEAFVYHNLNCGTSLVLNVVFC